MIRQQRLEVFLEVHLKTQIGDPKNVLKSLLPFISEPSDKCWDTDPIYSIISSGIHMGNFQCGATFAKSGDLPKITYMRIS